MIGLEYALGLYNMKHIRLAEILGIKKQNINLWIKEKQNIPTKYLPILSELFNTEAMCLTKEVDEIDKLKIQREKLKKDLQPIIKNSEHTIDVESYLLIGEEVIDKPKLDMMDMYINKAEFLERLDSYLVSRDNPLFTDNCIITIKLLSSMGNERMLNSILRGLESYFKMLSEGEKKQKQGEFEQLLFDALNSLKD